MFPSLVFYFPVWPWEGVQGRPTYSTAILKPPQCFTLVARRGTGGSPALTCSAASRSSCPRSSMPPHILRLSALPLLLSPEKHATHFPPFPYRLSGLQQPQQIRLLPHHSWAQNSLPLLHKSSSLRLGRALKTCALGKYSEPPSPSSAPTLLLPTLISLTALQLQLHASRYFLFEFHSCLGYLLIKQWHIKDVQ